MRYLNKITAEASQKFFLTGNTGQRITMNLRYMPSIQGWQMDLSYNDFTANGIHVVGSPNLLRNFKNIIPFGIACVVTDGLDPYYIDDFSSGRAVLYLLSEADVKSVETLFE